MKMNKLFTGLIALVAGLALSVGSAFAADGYMSGDPSRIKLVPYYETGDTKATIIGVQNMSMQEQSTIDLTADVTDIQAFLDGKKATANAAGLIGDSVAENESLCSPASDDRDCRSGEAQDPTKKANAEAALEKAMMNAQVEHVFVFGECL